MYYYKLPSSSPQAAFLNTDTARFRLDLQQCINFHGVVLCMQIVVYRSYNILSNTIVCLQTVIDHTIFSAIQSFVYKLIFFGHFKF
jgi:hypothetical protein